MLDAEIALGPGKADLLEALRETGSISAAGKRLGMSYRRTWDLVDTMNRCFKAPLVATATGGAHGGGAALTELGMQVLEAYRAFQAKAERAARAELAFLNGAVRAKPKP